MKIEWNTRGVLAAVDAHVKKGLNRAGKNTADAIKADLAHPGPAPSAPGEPPHYQSGQLHDAVGHTPPTTDERGPFTRIGVLDQRQWPKAVRLARGYVGTDKAGRTYNQKPRPYLGAVTRRRKQIVQEVARG